MATRAFLIDADDDVSESIVAWIRPTRSTPPPPHSAAAEEQADTIALDRSEGPLFAGQEIVSETRDRRQNMGSRRCFNDRTPRLRLGGFSFAARGGGCQSNFAIILVEKVQNALCVCVHARWRAFEVEGAIEFICTIAPPPFACSCSTCVYTCASSALAAARHARLVRSCAPCSVAAAPHARLVRSCASSSLAAAPRARLVHLLLLHMRVLFPHARHVRSSHMRALGLAYLRARACESKS